VKGAGSGGSVKTPVYVPVLFTLTTIPLMFVSSNVMVMVYVLVPGVFGPVIAAVRTAEAAPASARLATTAMLRVASFRMSILLVFPIFGSFKDQSRFRDSRKL
jgi:hypothetical protein